MKKLSNINEGWGAMIRRDLTDAVRDEEKVDIKDANNLLYMYIDDEAYYQHVINIDDVEEFKDYAINRKKDGLLDDINFDKVFNYIVSHWNADKVLNEYDILCQKYGTGKYDRKNI